MNPAASELAAIPLFEGLSPKQLAALASQFEVEEFEPGHGPTHTGAHGYAFFVVSEGTADVEIGGQVVERLEPGSTFGEMVFFSNDSKRTANVLPDGTLRVFSLFGTDFRVMQRDYPQVAARIKAKYDEHHARDEARQS